MGQYLSTQFFKDLEPFSYTSSQPDSINILNPSRPPISGKEGLSALRNAEYLDRYRDSVERNSINTVARRNQEYMPVPYSLNRSIPDNTNWPNGQVVWMDASADGGLPHTRPPHYICLPINLPDSILSQTLTHERIHLSQRAHPKQWQRLLKIAWNMTPWKGTLPGRIEHLRRINPDLLWAPLYAWKNEWVPVSVFTSSMPKSLSDTQLIWFHITSSTVHYDPPPGWVDFFGSSSNNEHPYEISAYLLADFDDSNPDQSATATTATSSSSNKALDALRVNLSSVYENYA